MMGNLAWLAYVRKAVFAAATAGATAYVIANADNAVNREEWIYLALGALAAGLAVYNVGNGDTPKVYLATHSEEE